MTITGTVIHGEARGRLLGFPTANVATNETIPAGVWAGSVRVMGGNEYGAAIFVHPGKALVEAYLLDFTGNLYKKEITLSLDRKIRDARSFDSPEALRSQIEKDIAEIRNE